MLDFLDDMTKKHLSNKVAELERCKNLNVGYELVKILQNGLIDRATGGSFDDEVYRILRTKVIQTKPLKAFIPQWLIDCRDIEQYWAFIKYECHGYANRRAFLYNEFSELLNYFENLQTPLMTKVQFDESYIHSEWEKAMERQSTDPAAAITTARSLLETVFKYILDESGTLYEEDKYEITDLYKKVAEILNMAPNYHKEKVFKQILGGVNSVILGLAALRNTYGDAHGKSSKNYRPKERHSEFAVNLSGSVALFLYKTFKESMNISKSK